MALSFNSNYPVKARFLFLFVDLMIPFAMAMFLIFGDFEATQLEYGVRDTHRRSHTLFHAHESRADPYIHN